MSHILSHDQYELGFLSGTYCELCTAMLCIELYSIIRAPYSNPPRDLVNSTVTRNVKIATVTRLKWPESVLKTF